MDIRKIGLEVPIVALCVIVIYWYDLTILLDEALSNEMASYILVLPFLIVYMIYRKKEILKAYCSQERESNENIMIKDIIGASLCLCAIFLYLYGSLKFNPLEYHLISLITFIFGCGFLIAGVQNIRNLLFPLGFTVLLFLPYREEVYQAGGQLSALTSIITYKLLRILNFPVSLSSTLDAPSIVIQTSSGQNVPFLIDLPCSGAFSLIGFLVFALFFAYVSHGSRIKKIVWLILGFFLIYSVNMLRTSLILMVCYWYGLDVAMGLFHLASGSVLIFVAVLLMLLIGEKTLKIKITGKEAENEEKCPLCEESQWRNEPFCKFCGSFFNPSNIVLPKANLGKIVALTFLAAILINMQVPAFTLGQQNIMKLEIHEMTGSKEEQSFLPSLEGYEPKFIYRDEKFEKMAKQEAALLYVYYPKNQSYAPIIVSVEIADSYSKLHRWEICLYATAQQPVKPIISKDVQILENPPLIGRFFTFKQAKSNRTVSILYWYEKSTFNLGSSWGSKYVKTSLIVYPKSLVNTGEIESISDYEEIENKLTVIARNITTYWRPVKTSSTLLLAFAQWGQTAAIITMAAASAAVIIIYFIAQLIEEKKAFKVYKQLSWYSTFSDKEGEILKLIEILGEKEELTGISLAEAYEKKTGKKIEPERLIEDLEFAEESGLIKRIIVMEEGKPKLLWKTNFTF